jgi:hypothetical protein
MFGAAVAWWSDKLVANIETLPSSTDCKSTYVVEGRPPCRHLSSTLYASTKNQSTNFIINHTTLIPHIR